MTSLQKRTAETPGAQRTIRTNMLMRGEACVCVTRYGTCLCEHSASAVTYPFCSGLNDDFAAKTHRRDAERAENFNNDMYARRSRMRWSDSLWHLSLRTQRRCSDLPFLQWTQ
jgi:hypothetical protein